MQLVLISGLSGSGKSVALNVLEDSGFYCVDNLPAKLLEETVTFLAEGGYLRVAITIDARSGASLAQLPQAIAALCSSGVSVTLLFLNARSGSLIRRFSETRRKHPLADGTLTLDECIQRERELVEPIAELGHTIDTSDLSPNALRQWVKDTIVIDRRGMTLLFESFAYKLGIPLEADMVFDVRCVPNPHYDPRLRPLTGLDPAVIAFLDSEPDAQRMLVDIGDYLERWLPCFIRDNRASLTIAIGCTGGQHRSVYFSERLAARFRPALPVLVRHRQLRME